MVSVLLLIAGLVGLWLGTRWLIRGALAIASKFGLSHSFVGLSILAIGTDLPEVFVTLKASLLQLNHVDSSGLIIGNALGSSISQITLILGLSSLFVTFKMKTPDLVLNGVFLIGSLFMIYFFAQDHIISRIEGISLLLSYILYYWLLSKVENFKEKENESNVSESFTPFIYLLFIAGLALLIFSSNLVVTNSLTLAKKLDLHQTFIGIAIIGVGTSLPELAISIGAAYRKSVGLSIGNIIGSNIFDGLIPVGLGSVINPVKTDITVSQFDLPALFFMVCLVLIFLATKRGISFREGMFLIAVYIIYLSLRMTFWM